MTDPTADPAPEEPRPVAAPASSSPSASDPEDWRSGAGAGDDERYLRDRPPHWQ